MLRGFDHRWPDGVLSDGRMIAWIGTNMFCMPYSVFCTDNTDASDSGVEWRDKQASERSFALAHLLGIPSS